MSDTDVSSPATGRAAWARHALWAMAVLAFLASTFYPSDLSSYRLQRDRAQGDGSAVAATTAYVTEHYGRHINTALQIGLPLAYRDASGLVQLLKVAVATTLATHGTKYLLNDVTIMDTRLGQRPKSPSSNNNMPSGHSSMASCGFYFTCRRYGWKFAIVMLPILLLTMFTRVWLDQHTVSAVMSGALIGILSAAPFTTRRQPRQSPPGGVPEKTH